jgi:hypothetical protein
LLLAPANTADLEAVPPRAVIIPSLAELDMFGQNYLCAK